MNDVVQDLVERLAEQEQRIAQLEAQLVAASLSGTLAGPIPTGDDRPGRTRRDLVRLAGAAGIAGVVGVTAASGRRASADFSGTSSGASTTQYGVYASPNGVSRPTLGGSVKFGIGGIGDAGVVVSNFYVPIGTYGASRDGWGVVGEAGPEGVPAAHLLPVPIAARRRLELVAQAPAQDDASLFPAGLGDTRRERIVGIVYFEVGRGRRRLGVEVPEGSRPRERHCDRSRVESLLASQGRLPGIVIGDANVARRPTQERAKRGGIPEV